MAVPAGEASYRGRATQAVDLSPREPQRLGAQGPGQAQARRGILGWEVQLLA